MSGKRSHDDLEGIHESRQYQVEGVTPKPVKKQRRDGPPKIRKQVHASSVNAVKKRIRDVTRLLQRAEDMPADVKLENERALAAYKQELAEADMEKVRQRMIKKYHMVRFFGKSLNGFSCLNRMANWKTEKQKATRMLKKLKKRLLEATNTEEVEEIKAQMHIYEVDQNYAHYYPLNERYVSLYPQRGKEKPEDEEESKTIDTSKKPELWAEIERRMEEGTLKELRYGVREGHVPKPQSVKQKALSKAASAKPRLASENSAFKEKTEKKSEKAPRAEPQTNEPKPIPDHLMGLNRRERRKAMLKTGQIVKPVKAATRPIDIAPVKDQDDGNISDGGFFEE